MQEDTPKFFVLFGRILQMKRRKKLGTFGFKFKFEPLLKMASAAKGFVFDSKKFSLSKEELRRMGFCYFKRGRSMTNCLLVPQLLATTVWRLVVKYYQRLFRCQCLILDVDKNLLLLAPAWVEPYDKWLEIWGNNFSYLIRNNWIRSITAAAAIKK